MPNDDCSTPIDLPMMIEFACVLLAKLYTCWIRATRPFFALGKKVFLQFPCSLQNSRLIAIGNNVTAHKDVWIHASRHAEQGDGPVLIIEDRCFIGRRSHICAKNRIHIERDVLLADSVLIEDHSHAFTDITRPIRDQGVTEGGRIRIGSGCWIGHGAAIVCDSGELTLGRNCVVGANSVVSRSAPPYSVLLGNPARIVKRFDPVKRVWVLGSTLQTEIEAGSGAALHLERLGQAGD